MCGIFFESLQKMTELDPSVSYQQFTSGHYDKAHEQLQKLLKSFEGKQDEVKILHNIAVNNFYLTGCTEPQKILDGNPSDFINFQNYQNYANLLKKRSKRTHCTQNVKGLQATTKLLFIVN